MTGRICVHHDQCDCSATSQVTAWETPRPLGMRRHHCRINIASKRGDQALTKRGVRCCKEEKISAQESWWLYTYGIQWQRRQRHRRRVGVVEGFPLISLDTVPFPRKQNNNKHVATTARVFTTIIAMRMPVPTNAVLSGTTVSYFSS